MKIKYILWLILLTIFLGCSAHAQSEVSSRPHKNSLSSGDTSYDWLTVKNLEELWLVTGDIEKIITTDELKKYFRLKLRNLVNHYSISDAISSSITEELAKGKGHRSMFVVKLQIAKYNDHLDIYVGFISFQMQSLTNFSTVDKQYLLVNLIAGSKGQIKGFIKEEIDEMVETLAEDFYMIADTIKARSSAASDDVSSAPE